LGPAGGGGKEGWDDRAVLIRVKKLRDNASGLPLPSYQTSGSVGMDLLADVDSPVQLPPGDRALIPTGLAFEIPEGFEGQIRPRSGLALRHGVTLLNAPGTIDSDYRGEVQVLLVNLGRGNFTVERGDRIAQIVIAPVVRVVLEEAGGLTLSDRGAGGFGHTDL
jgi:dUTP diphosphatase